jgi:SagB-type dehydrogenase family enzyme
VPRPVGGALVFTVGDKLVRVEGDERLVADVLARCDGRSTRAEIVAGFGDDLGPDVEELLSTLLTHEVIVDASKAYRTLHRQSSSTSGLFRALGPQQLEALMAERFSARSPSGRREPLAPPAGRLLELTARRSSARPGAAREVTYAELSGVLAAAYGTAPGARAVPSAGGLYPLVLHALIREPLDPLEPGLWWYDPAGAELQLLDADPLEVGDLFVREPLQDGLLAARRPTVFISADLERLSRKYSNRGYRYALMEVGAAMQSAYLAAAELDVPIRAIGGFHDQPVHSRLDLPDRVQPLLALLLGT